MLQAFRLRLACQTRRYWVDYLVIRQLADNDFKTDEIECVIGTIGRTLAECDNKLDYVHRSFCIFEIGATTAAKGTLHWVQMPKSGQDRLYHSPIGKSWTYSCGAVSCCETDCLEVFRQDANVSRLMRPPVDSRAAQARHRRDKEAIDAFILTRHGSFEAFDLLVSAAIKSAFLRQLGLHLIVALLFTALVAIMLALSFIEQHVRDTHEPEAKPHWTYLLTISIVATGSFLSCIRTGIAVLLALFGLVIQIIQLHVYLTITGESNTGNRLSLCLSAMGLALIYAFFLLNFMEQHHWTECTFRCRYIFGGLFSIIYIAWMILIFEPDGWLYHGIIHLILIFACLVLLAHIPWHWDPWLRRCRTRCQRFEKKEVPPDRLCEV